MAAALVSVSQLAAAFSGGMVGTGPRAPSLAAMASAGRLNSNALTANAAAVGAGGWQHVPNVLTLIRIAAIPVLGCTFYSKAAVSSRLPAILFGLMAFTDFADGYIARRFGAYTPFGAFLDPVADKVLVCVCLLLLSDVFGALVVAPAAVITAREIGVSALREWMASIGARESVAVGLSGKLKTATQMLSLQALLLGLPGSPPWLWLGRTSWFRIGLGLLYAAACPSPGHT